MTDPSELDRLLSESDAVQVARAALSRKTAWVVGGAVRDAALGREVVDLDLAVPEGTEQDAAQLLARKGKGHSFQLSERFATWRAAAPDRSWQIDIAALRGRAIEVDLAERDFTINAIALPLGGGEPIDPHRGLADLESGVLRAVSHRTFTDDPLRLLRAARLASALAFSVDRQTTKLAIASAERASEPAGERTFAELREIVAGPAPLQGLAMMDELGATPGVLPELAALRGVVQNPNHHLDVHGHTLKVLEELLAIEGDLERFTGERATEMQELLDEPLADELTRGGALRFAALLHDVGKPETRGQRGDYVTFIGHDAAGARIVAAICKRLRTSRKFSAYVQQITENHLRLGFLVPQRPLAKQAEYEYLRATEPVSADVTLLTVADRLAARGSGPVASEEMVEGHLELAREMLAAALDWRRDPPRPPVGGDELASELGIGPGPELGEILERLRAGVYTGEISTREDALELVRGRNL